ncbi:spore coat protein [Lentibacillus juripiscarius]|uniref:Spore coat protein n=1 Tax=Lentibacillus juripiscarius TaxID=257446 RepID=A0ABW5V207_9BACI
MDNNSSKHQAIPDQVVNVMIDEVFRKHNVKPDEIGKNISSEQKQMLKEMVEDLKVQVDQFNNGEKGTNTTNE